jgi:homoserine dehydrogenase
MIKKEIKVGLLGFGTVGSGVVRILHRNAALIEKRLGAVLKLVKIADLDIERDRGVDVNPEILTTDAAQVVDDPEVDIIIELIGGYEPARQLVLRALRNGKPVVTANKALLALYGEEIYNEAAANDVTVLFEAAAGGGIPVITSIKENLGGNKFSSVLGIFNGTCNYILTRMTDEGEEFADMLEAAQQEGFAEADPSFDVDGIDAAHKLAILVSLCFGTRIDFKDIYIEGISHLSSVDIRFAGQFGYKIKLLAIGKNSGGEVEARVHPTMVPMSHPLAGVDGVFNAVRLKGDFVGPVILTGQGAGMEATASAVIGDVISATRDLLAGSKMRTAPLGYRTEALEKLTVKAITDLWGQYYLRFLIVDRPGVLGKISTILGNHDISISSMIQMSGSIQNAAPVVLTSHEALEADIRSALYEIDLLEEVRHPSLFIRIENELE